MHDVAPALAKEASLHDRDETETIWAETCDFPAWPDVLPGGHLIALSHPRELATLLASYVQR